MAQQHLPAPISEFTQRGVRAAQMGLLVNALLVAAKLSAGILGHAYALIADAIESSTDIVSSSVVWAGLRVAELPADENHPFGHGKAEAIAGAVASLILLGAAIGIALAAIHQIQTPHHLPAPFTLAVAGVVILIKGTLYRRVSRVAASVESVAVRADAWHHRSDAISSAAAFVGIGVALVGNRLLPGRRWETADDWGALVAATVVAANGVRALQIAVAELMDAAPSGGVLERVQRAAAAVPGVELVEHVKVRRSGLGYYVDLHAQADPTMSLYDAHVLSGRIKGSILEASPRVRSVLVHMEPFARRPTAQ
jgi:cation diffusion facilitator family transporter